MTKEKKLTDQQELFLQALFSLKSGGEVREAMRIAGYSDNYDSASLIKSVEDELLERSKRFLSSHSPKAIQSLIEVLHQPDKLGAAVKLKAAESILNRTGLKEKAEVATKGENEGVVILPPKAKKVTIEIDGETN